MILPMKLRKALMMEKIEISSISAEVYNKDSRRGITYVKLTLDDMYISGITVRESLKYPGEPWIQMPSYRGNNGRYGKYIEFASDSLIKEKFEKVIKCAVLKSDETENDIDLDAIDF